MDVLHDPPSGFAGIAKVFQMARQLPTSHQLNVRIGLASEGVLFAAGRLDGYRQINFLADHLRSFGWREHLLGGDQDMHGCDMLFSEPPGAALEQADPSFIRRTPLELWPVATHHADQQ